MPVQVSGDVRFTSLHPHCVRDAPPAGNAQER